MDDEFVPEIGSIDTANLKDDEWYFNYDFDNNYFYMGLGYTRFNGKDIYSVRRGRIRGKMRFGHLRMLRYRLLYRGDLSYERQGQKNVRRRADRSYRKLFRRDRRLFALSDFIT